MTDRVVRASDNNAPLLDGDGEPISELELDQVDAAVDRGASVAELAADQRSWRYGHVIVDEAQDLTPMQWRMIARRTRGESMTVVGDLAQRSIGEPGEWSDHLPSSLSNVSYQELTVNYRAPAEVNELARDVLAELAPNLKAPRSIRSVGTEPVAVHVNDVGKALPDLVVSQQRLAPAGTTAVIGLELNRFDIDPSAEKLSPWQSKGLEFDSVLIVEPDRILDEEFGLSLLYVAITRSTCNLLIVHSEPLPNVLARSVSRRSQID